MSETAAEIGPVPDVIAWNQVEYVRRGRAVLATEGQALAQLSQRLDAAFADAVEQILNCAGTVIVTGVGKAGLIGQKLAATFCSTGTRSVFLHPTEAVHGDLGCLHPSDLLLLLSNSGETEELTRLLDAIAGRDVGLVAITASQTSTLGSRATVSITLGRLVEAGLHGLPPTTSTTAMLAVGDALAVVVAEARGFTPQQFGQLHPAGSLGRKLTPVTAFMRRDDELRLAPENGTVREVLTQLQRPGRRTGAVMLTDDDGRLSGLFTDSDLARLLEQRRDSQLDRPIREVMTVRPTTVASTAIFEEVVQLLSARRLSEVPVIDEQGRPMGLIDITDLIGVLPPVG
jgi:arabinose-5-phosphate isomerase